MKRAPSRCSDEAFVLQDKSNADNKSADGMLFPRVDSSASAFGKQALTLNQQRQLTLDERQLLIKDANMSPLQFINFSASCHLLDSSFEIINDQP